MNQDPLHRGECREGVFLSSSVFPGTRHEFRVVVPDVCRNVKTPLGLVVSFDAMDFTAAMNEAVREGSMPPCAGLFVRSGQRSATRPDGFNRSNRSQEYDGLGPDVPDFLINELIPFVREKYALNLSDDPDFHMVCGCSSGGIAAWNAAWERNDFFHRVILFSPTFCAFRGGDFYPAAVRKYEPKKIRCFMITGTADMENSAGAWYLEDLRMAAALRYARYAHVCEIMPGGVHGCGSSLETKLRALRFCWKDWKITGVSRPDSYAPCLNDILSPDSDWERISSFPSPAEARIPEGTYTGDGSNVLFRGNDGSVRVAASGFGRISGLAVSPDHWRLYIADSTRRFIFVMSVCADGSLKDSGKFGHLDTADDFRIPGALDVTSDSQDRVYAATELGIQTFSSQSEHNCILPLPGKRTAAKLHLSEAGEGVDPYMTVLCTDGAVFRRKWKQWHVSGTGDALEPSTRPF